MIKTSNTYQRYSKEFIESEIRYNEANGIHTFSPCNHCGKGCRSSKCSACWRKLLNGVKE